MEVIRDYKRLFPSSMDRAYDLSRDQWHVRDIMSGEVITTTPEASMGEAARAMGDRRIGSLIVLVDSEPGGIFTERDLLTGFLAPGRPLDVPVGEVCSSPLLAIPTMTPVNVAAYVMSSRRVRRLPAAEGEELAGIVTA